MYDFFKRRSRSLLFLLLAFALFFIIQNAGAKNSELKNSDLDLNKSVGQVNTENKHLLQEKTETAPLAVEQPQENMQLAIKPSIPEEPIASNNIPESIPQNELLPSPSLTDEEDPFLNDEFFNSFNTDDKPETEAKMVTPVPTSTPASPIEIDSSPVARERSPDVIAPLAASSQSESATPPSSETQSGGCHLGFATVWMLCILLPIFCRTAENNH